MWTAIRTQFVNFVYSEAARRRYFLLESIGCECSSKWPLPCFIIGVTSEFKAGKEKGRTKMSESKRIEQTGQKGHGAELSEQDLDKVAGGIAVSDQAQPSGKPHKPTPVNGPLATGSTTAGSAKVTPVGSGG